MSEPAYAAETVSAPAPVLSVSPVVLPAPGRAVDLQVRVSAPVTGSELPVILLSHGHGPSNNLSSLNGYAPLANFWAAHGFAVIQPTHLSSRTLSLDPDDPEAPLYWRSRAEDMTRILDQLDVIEAAVPRLPGRLDPSKVAVAGHSMGGHTASLLLGARLTDPHDGTEVNLAEPRIKAGVLLAAPGRGGDALTEPVAEHYSFFLTTDFSQMTTPALVVAGDKDTSAHLTVRRGLAHRSVLPLPRPQVPAHPVRRRARARRGLWIRRRRDHRRESRAGGRGRAAHLGLPPHRALPRGLRLAGSSRRADGRIQPTRTGRVQVSPDRHHSHPGHDQLIAAICHSQHFRVRPSHRPAGRTGRPWQRSARVRGLAFRCRWGRGALTAGVYRHRLIGSSPPASSQPCPRCGARSLTEWLA